MLKALAIKELRESAAILGVAAVAMAWLLGNLTGSELTPFKFNSNVVETVPFVNTEFSALLMFAGGVLAISLGLKQSAWENGGNKYYFLLHRPTGRHTVFLVKIIFGLSCLLLLTIGPLLIYANWASIPGRHASPFEWSMTSTSWMICLTLPTIYLGAMLSGLRPAQWFGTRLLPGVGAGILTVLSAVCWWQLHWIPGLICLLVLDVLLVLLILATAERRDY